MRERIKNGRIFKEMRIGLDKIESFEDLVLRKRGFFLAKTFRHAHSLNLLYQTKNPLKTKHMHKIVMGMNGNMKKISDLSIKFEFKEGSIMRMAPLLEVLERDFACLTSLKLSFPTVLKLGKTVLEYFDSLFKRLRTTLKKLELDFGGNKKYDWDFSEALGQVIMERLHKLESLSLNFNWMKMSVGVVQLLINGACTHLMSLKRLEISLESSKITRNCLKSYKFLSKSYLQSLRLNLNGCEDMSIKYLSMLQNDIIVLCPRLQELDLTLINCNIPFQKDIEKEFLRRLKLKRYRLLFSLELENTWKKYQEIQDLEDEELKEMEKETLKIKQKAGGEEEFRFYYNLLTKKEENVLTEYEFNEQEFLQEELDKKEMADMEYCDEVEEEIRRGEEEEKENQIYVNSYEEFGFSEVDYEGQGLDVYEDEESDTERMERDFLEILEEEQAAMDLYDKADQERRDYEEKDLAFFGIEELDIAGLIKNEMMGSEHLRKVEEEQAERQRAIEDEMRIEDRFLEDSD